MLVLVEDALVEVAVVEEVTDVVVWLVEVEVVVVVVIVLPVKLAVTMPGPFTSIEVLASEASAIWTMLELDAQFTNWSPAEGVATMDTDDVAGYQPAPDGSVVPPPITWNETAYWS